MSLEQDFRDFLVAANTPAGVHVWFTTAQQNQGPKFITISLLADDAYHTTQAGPGHLAFATIEALCSVKGTDQYSQYVQAAALRDAVRNAVASVTQWPLVMGNTTVYFMSVETTSEVARTRGAYSNPYQYHDGRSSGIQSLAVPVAINYWNPAN